MISRFFIDRPIFATVLSIVITLTGGIALTALPIAMYPQISPPTVAVDCNYPGASAQVVSDNVAVPIEQQVNGVEDMLYMSSQCTNDGSYNLTVTFKHGVNLNMAQVLVQNRVSLAIPLLPDVIKQTGVNVRKIAPDILLSVALTSPQTAEYPKGRFDQLFLSNYALLRVKDELARLPGVSDIRMLGQRDYSMRIWVDPGKLAARGLAAGDVARALRDQNLQVATGQIGQEPVPKGQAIQVPLSTLGRLNTVEQFERIIVRMTADGRMIRIKDVARVELGAKNQDIAGNVNGREAVSLAVFQLPDANALTTADIVKAKMAELARDFPEGVVWEIRYDTTPFISESINEVFKTLREAVLLVAIVVLLFLQNWRSALIPLVAVPVAIVGTFAAMALLGFTLNNLTLFGLVLAIGIVVDDAIVVVEAVEHHIEGGMSPRDATIQAMEEVSGPVIAIGLVLTAVFVPCAFISGIVGQFFRQFALTIAVSTIISAFNSLTLSPALAALLLKPRQEGVRVAALPKLVYAMIGGYFGYDYLASTLAGPLGRAYGGLGGSAATPMPDWGPVVAATVVGALAGWVIGPLFDRLLSAFFRGFNAAFRVATRIYGRLVGGLLRVSAIVLVVYVGLLFLTYLGFKKTPSGFIPSQDMGYLLVNVQLPDSASAERSRALMNKIERIAKDSPGVKFTQTMAGQSLLLSANGSNFGSMFVILDSFPNRAEPATVRLVDGKPTLIPHKTDVGVQQREVNIAPMYRNKLVKEGDEVAVPLDSDTVQKSFRDLFDAEVPEAMLTVLGPPPVRGVGRAGGFKVMVEDRGDVGSEMLQEQADRLTALATADPRTPEDLAELVASLDAAAAARRARLKPAAAPPKPKEAPQAKADPGATPKAPPPPPPPSRLVGLVSVFRANVPQIYFKMRREEAITKDVPLRDLFDTLRIYLGSLYVNDFNLYGRTWQVVVQADQVFRNQVEDVRRLKVRNQSGGMVPLAAVADIQEQPGPLILTRYNMYPAAPVNGSAAPGTSSGEAIRIIDDLTGSLDASMSHEWTELAFLELQAGNTAMLVFAFAVVMVFLVLAAQYERWSLPMAIILVVPMCLLSAIIGVRYAKQDVNIFTQIGFVVLVGLASKNAILIVEFAKARREAGESPRQAALDACTLRLRPIIMTSLAFIFGVIPLILSRGAGAEMRRTLGTTVFSGMVGVTLFGIVLTPVFFYVVERLGESAVFRSRLVRKFAGALLYPLRLPVRGAVAAVGYARRELARVPRRPEVPAKPPERTEELVELK